MQKNLSPVIKFFARAIWARATLCFENFKKIQFFVTKSAKVQLLSDDKDISKHFKAGIKRLGEIADSNFSLLHSILKCITLAQIFKIEIDYDQRLVEEYFQIVINKIISGGI